MQYNCALYKQSANVKVKMDKVKMDKVKIDKVKIYEVKM